MNSGIKPIVSSLAVFSLLNIGNTTPDLKDISYVSNYSVWLQEYHKLVVDKYISKRNNWTTSVLGDVLFKNKQFPPIDEQRRNKTFQVLLWKYWSSFASRFLYRFGSTEDTSKLLVLALGDQRAGSYLGQRISIAIQRGNATSLLGTLSRDHLLYFEIQKIDPLEECSVKNCKFHGNRVLIHEVDAVLVIVGGVQVPKAPFRKWWQRWIFFTDESPPHAVASTKIYNFHKYSDSQFNWSMTYRSDADIPIPYGRTIPLEKPLPVSTLESLTKVIPYWDKKIKKVAAMISNCRVKYRLKIIETLKEYMEVDFYGGCGDETFRMRCPGRYKSDCQYLSQYYFYLALENSHCRQYITEKVFYNSFLNGAIPIIKGPPVADCEKLLPPHSFLHIDNFESIEALAQEIVNISENIDRLLSYHLWRAHFRVTSESGYFGVPSTTLCRVCEALNYNSMEPSIYTPDDIKLFLEPRIVCDISQLQITKPIIIRKATNSLCYELGKESCVNL